MNPQEVLIPARRFQVEVVLGPHDGLSLVEQYVVRGIALGAETVETVARALVIPERMVLDIAVDLLSRGLVEVHGAGVLRINERIQEAIGDPSTPNKDWFLNFQSAHLPEPRTVSLVQELVAGGIFSLPRVPFDRERLPTMPENDSVPALDEIPLATLVSAVISAMRQHRRRSGEATPGDDLRDAPLPRDARILSVRLARASLAGETAGPVTTGGMRILARVIVSSRGDDEAPRVAIVEPAAMPAHVRRTISTALGGLWASGFARGPNQFFTRIHASSASRDAGYRPSLMSPAPLLREMASIVADLKRPYSEAHGELLGIEPLARESVENLAAHDADSELMVGTASTFRNAAFEALREANEQVVLGCPWIGQIGRDRAWQDALRDAIVRGVKVALIWGIDAAKIPENEPTWRVIRSLVGEESRGSLVLADRGAASHAKLIVCDASWALVTSCNYLNAPADRVQREVGARVRLQDGTAVPLALQTVLGWARRLIPDYAARERCVDSPVLFGLQEARPNLRIAADPIGLPDIRFKETGVQIWRKEWRDRVVELEETARATAAAVIPVFDGDHREILISAIEKAQVRVLIESHRVSPYGLTSPIADAILAALARGVAVRVHHAADVEVDPLSRERLEALRAAGATVVGADTHAKVLLYDDWAVVSSFNFLSADPSLRGARELGLRTNDHAFVEALWSTAASM